MTQQNNDVQAALKVVNKFISAKEKAEVFLPVQTSDTLSEWLSCFTHHVNYRISYSDWEKLELVKDVLTAQQQPDDEIYKKFIHTQSDLEHSRAFARDLSLQLDKLKRECSEAKIELARIRKQQPVNEELLEATKRLSQVLTDMFFDGTIPRNSNNLSYAMKMMKRSISRAEAQKGQ